MTPADFVRVAFTPSLRPQLLAALKGDHLLRAAAEQRIASLEEGQKVGMVMDRCHISKTEYETLKAMLAQVDADKEPPATVETL